MKFLLNFSGNSNMTAPAAIQGDYVDLRFIKSRKVCQIVIEVPIEAGAVFVAAFGTPNPATTVPVAIARIDPKAKSVVAKRKWDELSIAQQAGILCGEPAFQNFVGERIGKPHLSISVADAAQYVRQQCGVNSRAHIEGKPEAERIFRDLEASYEAWKTL
jgi:hypothetical protein